IALGHLQVGIRALGDDAGRDGIVHETALYAARVGIAHHVGRIVVELDLFEDTAFLDGLDKRSAHLHAYGHAFHVGERLVFLVVVLGHHEPFAIAVYRLGETDNLLAGLGNEHGRRDQVDTLGCQRADQRRERHGLDLHLEPGLFAHGTDDVHHDTFNGVGFGVQEGEWAAGRRRADLEHG